MFCSAFRIFHGSSGVWLKCGHIIAVAPSSTLHHLSCKQRTNIFSQQRQVRLDFVIHVFAQNIPYNIPYIIVDQSMRRVQGSAHFRAELQLPCFISKKVRSSAFPAKFRKASFVQLWYISAEWQMANQEVYPS